jgi:hypothetical protein
MLRELGDRSGAFRLLLGHAERKEYQFTPEEVAGLARILEAPLPAWAVPHLLPSRYARQLIDKASPEWFTDALVGHAMTDPSLAYYIAKHRALRPDHAAALEAWAMEWFGPRIDELVEHPDDLSISCTLIYLGRSQAGLSDITRRQLLQWACTRDLEEEQARSRARAHNHQVQNRPGVHTVGGRDEVPVPVGPTCRRASIATEALVMDRRTPAEWLLKIFQVQAGAHNAGMFEEHFMRHPALRVEHLRQAAEHPYVERHPTVLLDAPDHLLRDPVLRARFRGAERLEDWALERLVTSAPSPEEAGHYFERLHRQSAKRAWALLSSGHSRWGVRLLPTSVLAPWLSSSDPKVREAALRLVSQLGATDAPRFAEAQHPAPAAGEAAGPVVAAPEAGRPLSAHPPTPAPRTPTPGR